jgi:hypothetical protein
MPAEAVEAATRKFKKAIIERADRGGASSDTT